MTTVSKGLLDYLKSHEKEILEDLEEFVKKESPSSNKALVDECGEHLHELFVKRLGAQAEVITQSEVGNHVNYPRLRFAKKRGLLGESLDVGFLFHQPLPSALASGLTQLPQA